LVEQTKIANFLSDIDEKINLLKEKKSLLEEYKKGIMQKIFNQEIRFKDDNDNDFVDWEEKSLGDVAKFRRGSFPQPYGLPQWYDDENGMPFIQVYDVGSNMLLKDVTKNKISKLGAKQSVFVKKGTLVLTIQGSIGRIAKTQYDAYIDRTLLIFQSYNLPIDIDYFKYVVFLLFEIEKTKAPGGTIKTITKEVLTEFTVPIPCIDEQTKIANFLSSIDEKIELVNTQIQDTQEYKKGLLQQMFV
jgi:type I restriction enzyme S subunit